MSNPWADISSFCVESMKVFLSRISRQDLSSGSDFFSRVPHFVWIAAGLVLLAAVAGRVSILRKYGNPLVEFAKKFGFRFQEDHDYFLEHDLRPFTFSGLSKVSPRLFYVLSAVNDKGVRFKLFDFNATRAVYGIRRFRGQTMGYADLPGRFFPHAFITPKTLVWRWRLRFSPDRFVTEGIPARFLKKYVVIAGPEEPFPKFRPELFDRMLFWKGYSLETKHDRLIFYRAGEVIPLRSMIVFYKRLVQIADILVG